MKTKQLLLVSLMMLGSTPLFAQQAGIARFPLQNVEVNVPGRILIQARVEIEPGVEGGKHTHPGIEIAYVIEGQLEVKVDGLPNRTYRAGEAFSVAEGVAHAATNTGTVTTKLLATYLVEVGKPLATPFK
jgi:quercetin dioxygenase-like cupin family protein